VSGLIVLAGVEGAAAQAHFLATGRPLEVISGPTAERLRQLDKEGLRYVLIHVGEDNGEAEGSYERAHHRVTLADVPELALRLRQREKKLVTCLAFGYKNGVPPDATWLVDVRFLDNPYWEESLRPLDGRDPAVTEYVLRQPAARELLDRLESVLRWSIPLYQRDELTVAFGCTGGRHRSVALAQEMAVRVSAMEGLDVEFRARDL